MKSTIMEWARGISDSLWAEAGYTFLIVFGILVLNAILKRALGLFTRRANDKGSYWQAIFLEATSPPLRGLIWVIGLSVAIGILTRSGNYSLLGELFPPARDVSAIALIAWFLFRVISGAEQSIVARAMSAGRTLDPTAIDAIGKLVRAAVFVTTGLLIMQSLGLSIGGLVALGGVGGIALGFAAQSLVANLVGGLTIYASRPFNVGEWIILPGTEIMGEVQEIGWRATRIMGFDRRPFYVPNAMFNTAAVINHSRMTARRIMEHIHIRKDDIGKVQAMVADVNEMLAAHPGIHHDFFAFNFDTYGDFSLKLFLYAFTVSTSYNDYLNVKEDILVKIAEIVRKHGGALAVPTTTVHVPEVVQLSQPRKAAGEPLIDSLVEGLSKAG